MHRMIFVVGLALVLTGCRRPQETISMPTDETLAKFALRFTDQRPRVVADTDRVGGFWQGHLFAANDGSGRYGGFDGYTAADERLLADCVWWLDGERLNLAQAREAIFHPDRIEHCFADGTVSGLMVLPGEMGLLLTLTTRTPRQISFQPLWIDQAVKLVPDERGVLRGRSGSGRIHIALAACTDPALRSNNDHKKPDSGILSGGDQTLHLSAARSVQAAVLFASDSSALTERLEILCLDPGAALRRKQQEILARISRCWVETADPQFNLALIWAHIAGRALVVDRFGTGIWAGLPWFNQNWGRDTFIALPGISLVTGSLDEARAILSHFAAWQQSDPASPLFGRIPNRVVSPTDIIYNTADGTPWLIRELKETLDYTGDIEFARELYPVVQRAINGSRKNSIDRFGFLTHGDADTWMDARIRGEQAWSPRGDRAVEIQALWIAELEAGAEIAHLLGYESDAREWKALAEQARIAFKEHFVAPNSNALADHLNSDGSADLQVRPNAVMALSLHLDRPLVADSVRANVLEQLVSRLTYPWGVASLAQEEENFHPFHHDQIYHFDAAYHNGMCWHWTAGPVISAMIDQGHREQAFRLSKNLAAQILELDMPGSLSELVEPLPDDAGRVRISGTYSQAWSVSEFARVVYQDYLGLRPQWLDRTLVIRPALPKELSPARFRAAFGDEEILSGRLSCGKQDELILTADELQAPIRGRLQPRDDLNRIYEFRFDLAPDQEIRLQWRFLPTPRIRVDGGKWQPLGEPIRSGPGRAAPAFQKPQLRRDLPALLEADALEKKLLHEVGR
ncbi:MAG TPA: amylo-alpha-1,6-glucosidase [bacterium]|nr:amylo-alpha-1,6-glucosidase [bacterium]